MNEDCGLAWMSEVKMLELQVEAPYVFLMDDDSKFGIDDVAWMMVQGGPIIVASAKQPEVINLYEDRRPEKSYWDSFKREFCIFLCEKDRKYTELHKALATSGNKSSTVVLTLISAALSPHVGLSAGLLVPFGAVCLYAMAKVGKEAYCRSCNCLE